MDVYHRTQGDVWSDDRIGLLKKLWGDGLGASQIADELGGITRNAVIGKIHRLGLSGRQRPAATPKANQAKGSADAALARKIVKRAAAAKAAEPKPAISAQTHHTDSGGGLQRKIANKAEQRRAEPTEDEEIDEAATEAIELPADESQFAVTFFKANETQCRWPLGDPSNLDTFRFCGAPKFLKGCPYCSRHSKIAGGGMGRSDMREPYARKTTNARYTDAAPGVFTREQ